MPDPASDPQPPTNASAAQATPENSGKSTAAAAGPAVQGAGKPAPKSTAPAQVIPAGGRRSLLITWMLRLFLFFQGVALLAALFDLIVPTNFSRFPLLTFGLGCFQHLALVPVVLAILVWLMAPTNRYIRTAVYAAKLILLHFVLRVAAMLLAGMTLLLILMAQVPHLMQSGNKLSTLEAEATRFVTEHQGLCRLLALAALVFEAVFALLAWLAHRQLRAGHFIPTPAAAGSPPPAKPDTAGQAAQPAPLAAAGKPAEPGKPDTPAESAQSNAAAKPSPPLHGPAPTEPAPTPSAAVAESSSVTPPPAPPAGGKTSPSGE